MGDVRSRVMSALVPAVLAPTLALHAVAQAQPAPAQGNNSPFFGSTPPKQRNPFGTPTQQTPATVPARAASPVIARVAGRDLFQSDFDRIAEPYFLQLKSQFGAGFNGEMQRTASFNVLDELIRRELLAVESQREKIEVSQDDVDKILMGDPFFQTDGKFDAAKFAAFKSDPRSNYQLILPRLRETAAMRKLDESLRQRFQPTTGQVRAEWSRRFDKVRFKMLALLAREMPLESEASQAEWSEYYRAHPDEFARHTRIRLRYVRLPLPAEGDSARSAAESRAVARAKAVADSLRRHALPDSAAELTDTGPFDIPAPFIPGLGKVQGLDDALAKVDADSTVRVIGPFTAPDAVFVAAVAERRGKQVPPLDDVLVDVKRRADNEHQRKAIEAEHRAYFDAHREDWHGRRVAVTRVTLRAASIAVKPAAPPDVDRWYAQHGRRLFGKPDTSRAWIPPLSDSLRLVVRRRIGDEQQAARAGDIVAKLTSALHGGRDLRAVARENGAAVETLSVFKQANADTLWPSPFSDSLLAATPVRGSVQGPRRFGASWVAWRVDGVDTAFVAPYELVRARSDLAYDQERAKKEEDQARVYFDQHRGEFKAAVKYGLDYITVAVPPPDSVRLTDAEVRHEYETNRVRYRQEEQIKARHILFLTRGLGPETEKKAKARADSLLAAIRQHGAADFEDLAKRFSEEPSAAETGGDLGWFGRHRMVKEFEDAAFALKAGEISPVVKTMFGYHIIKVEDRKAAGVRPFEEVRPELRSQMIQARRDSSAMRTANGLRRRLALGGDAKALGARYGGLVEATPVGTNESVSGLGFVPGLSDDLPHLTVGRWAPKAYRVGNHTVVFRLRQKVAQHPAEFAEAKAQAVEATRNQKRRDTLNRKVESLRAALGAGAAFDSLARPYGGLRDSGPLTQTMTFLPMLGPEPRVVEKAFAAKVGAISDTLQVTQGVVWFRVEERIPGDPATFTTTSAQIESELTKKRYDAWVEERKKTVKIEIIRSDLKGPRPVAAATFGG